jgi:hypothetical protein
VPNISKESVIYPKTGEKRWWKIQEIEEKTGGWLMIALPSNYTPSFES